MIYAIIIAILVIVAISRYIAWRDQQRINEYLDLRYGVTIDGVRWHVYPGNGPKPRNMALLYNSRMGYVKEAKP